MVEATVALLGAFETLALPTWVELIILFLVCEVVSSGGVRALVLPMLLLGGIAVDVGRICGGNWRVPF